MRQLHLKNNFLLIVSVITFLFISGCEKNTSALVDSSGTAPVLNEARFSLSVVNTDSMYVGGGRTPDDVLTITGTASMRIGRVDQIGIIGFSVLRAATGEVIGSGVLSDLHVSHDFISNDSVYTGTATFQITRVTIGTIYLILWAESKFGYRSTSHYIPLSIIRLNHPPVISNLQMDTLVQIESVDQKLTVKIKAIDQNGQSDISKVYFNSYKPDGSPSSGNPFFMYDDGSNGDGIAGDSIYTLIVLLPSTTTLGAYRFEFHAVDLSGTLSNTIIQTITITQ